MNRKNLPLLMMLVAGAITCIITMIQDFPMVKQLIILLIALLVFYILGSVIKGTLDHFEKLNAESAAAEENTFEMEPEETAEGQTPEGQ